MNRLTVFCLLWLLLLGGATSCSSTNDAAEPACVGDFSATLIEQLKQKPKQTPAAEVTQYTYQNRTVYLVTGGWGGLGRIVARDIALHTRGATDVSGWPSIKGRELTPVKRTILLDLSSLKNDDGSVLATS